MNEELKTIDDKVNLILRYLVGLPLPYTGGLIELQEQIQKTLREKSHDRRQA